MHTKTTKTIEINYMEEEDKDDEAHQEKNTKSKKKASTKKIAVPKKTLKKNPETHDTMSQELPSSIPAPSHAPIEEGLREEWGQLMRQSIHMLLDSSQMRWSVT